MDYALYQPCQIATSSLSGSIVANPASKGISVREGLIPNAIAVEFVEESCY